MTATSVPSPYTAMLRPRILVSNDDGIRAPGLQSLVRELHACGHYDVRVGAPETERSGSSHAVTSSVQATRYSDGTAVGLPSDIVCYAASGYPTDAVRLAFQSGRYPLLHHMGGPHVISPRYLWT